MKGFHMLCWLLSASRKDTAGRLKTKNSLIKLEEQLT